MTDMALVTADRVRVVDVIGWGRQFTAPAGANITAGQVMILAPATGKWAVADASGASTATGFLYIATATVLAGEALTGIRRGVMDGWDLSALDYGAVLYLSDTAGAVADANGTVNRKLGCVVPGQAVTLGTAYDKLFEVDSQF